MATSRYVNVSKEEMKIMKVPFQETLNMQQSSEDTFQRLHAKIVLHITK